MAKDAKEKIPQITFRCTSEQKESLEILAAATLQDVSAIMVKLVDELINANAERISLFKAQAATPLMMPTVKPAKKSARASKKKSAAQVAPPTPPTVEFAPNAAVAMHKAAETRTITVKSSKVESPPTVVHVTMHGGASDVDEVKGSGDNENT